MHNIDEQRVFTAGLVCLCPLVVTSLVVPGVGYVLLGLVVLGVASLITAGVRLWWETRYQPDNVPRRTAQDTRLHQAWREVA